MKIHGVPQRRSWTEAESGGCIAAIIAGLIVLVFGVLPTIGVVWICWHFIAKWW